MKTLSSATSDQTLADRAERVAAAFTGPAYTGNATSDAVHAMAKAGQLSGPVVPMAWFNTIRRNGRPDYDAIIILADLVGLLRPTFDVKAGKWRSYLDDFMASAYALGISSRAYRAAVCRLNKMGVAYPKWANGELVVLVNIEVLKQLSSLRCS